MKQTALEPTCPVGTAISALAGRWRSSIVCALLDAHPQLIRYTDLQRRASAKAGAPLSRKTLSQELRAMMDQGLATRAEGEAVKPPLDVRYGLTEWGAALGPAADALAAWALRAPGQAAATRESISAIS